MQTRELGRTGERVAPIGLGTMGMTGLGQMPEMYGETDDAESLATIRRAVELGVSLFDTAEVYGPYRNEELLGRGLGADRKNVVVASKFGFRIGDDGVIAGTDGTPANMQRSLDGCLARLGSDYIDLWYLHRLDPATPIEETVGAMADAVSAGKVRWLGLSEVSEKTLRRAHAVHPITALQSEYSLWERNIEGSISAACDELGVTIVPYCPLGRGFLSGTVAAANDLPDGDYRRNDPRFAADNHARNLAIVKTLTDVAERRGASAAQVALAWLLHRNERAVPIPGTKKRHHLEDNVTAAAIALESNDLAALERCDRVAGDRYGKAIMATIDR